MLEPLENKGGRGTVSTYQVDRAVAKNLLRQGRWPAQMGPQEQGRGPTEQGPKETLRSAGRSVAAGSGPTEAIPEKLE